MEKFVENFARRNGGRKRRSLRPLRRRTSLEKGAVFLFSGCCGSTVLRVACDIPDDRWYIIDFLKLEPFSLDGDGKALAIISEFLVGDTISIVGTLTGDQIRISLLLSHLTEYKAVIFLVRVVPDYFGLLLKSFEILLRQRCRFHKLFLG